MTGSGPQQESIRARVVADGMRGVYERQAALFDRVRRRDLAERVWLDRVLACSDPGDTVLDLGCGAGEPIAQYVIGQVRRVCGVDFAAPMIEMARARFPDERWLVADMRQIELDQTFGAIIGWDSFFHLTPNDQRALIPRLARHLRAGGGLLLTVGPDAGEPLGEVGGEPVYHASLSPADYRAVLAEAGLQILSFVPNDPTCGSRSVLFAQRIV